MYNYNNILMFIKVVKKNIYISERIDRQNPSVVNEL